VEVLERWHTNHHVRRPTVFLAVITLALGLAHGRIAAFSARRRALRVTAHGISIRRRPFGRFTRRWDQVRDITIDAREAVVHTHDGTKRRIDLQDLQNAPEVIAALEEGRRRTAAADVNAKRPPVPIGNPSLVAGSATAPVAMAVTTAPIEGTGAPRDTSERPSR
jgi:hypothetical protein